MTEGVCQLIQAAINSAQSAKKTVMQEMISANVNIIGNFICAKPDGTAFCIDTTQAMPSVTKFT
jgi:hypothetical protein